MADTLQELLGQVSAFSKGADTATQQVISALGAQTALSNDNAAVYKQQATDDATVAAAKQAADFKTQLARVRGANLAGANLNDQSEVLSGLSAAAADAQKRKDEALASIQEKDSVSFIDNPLQYIVNQFTVNGDISKHNIANSQLESAHNRIMEVNAEAQQTALTQNAISEPLTAASMAAATRSAAAAATVAANKSTMEGLSYNTKGIEFALNAKKEVLSLAFSAESAKRAEQQTQISLQSLDLQKKEFEQRKLQYKEHQDDVEEQRALGQSFIDRINLGRKALLGPNAEPLDDMSGKMAIAALKGKGTLSAELQKYYDAGERTAITGKASYGSSPAQAVDTLTSLPVQLNPTQTAVKNVLGQAATDTSAALKNAGMPGQSTDPVFAGLDKKDKGSINSAMNGRAQQILDGYSKVINPGDSNNPYQVGSINQLAANSPTIQGLPLYQKVFAPLVKGGVQLSDPKQIVSIVGSALAKGTITHDEALDLSTIYHVGVSANLAMRNFSAFGLVPKNSYRAQVETDPSAFHPNEVIDLTKPDEISRALMKIQASKYRDAMSEGSINIFSGKSNNTSGQIFDPDGMKFGPKSNYPASEEAMSKADKAFANGWK